MRDGKPLTDMLRTERVALEELLESARQQGISDLADVEVGVLEPDGRFAFLGRKTDGHTAPGRHQG